MTKPEGAPAPIPGDDKLKPADVAKPDAEGARTKKKKQEIARELAQTRPEFLLALGAGRFWMFPPILPGDQAASVVYLDQGGIRDEYSFSLADYKAFAEKMLATARAAH